MTLDNQHLLFHHQLIKTYLPRCVDPPTFEEIQEAIRSMKNNKPARLDHTVTAEAPLQWAIDSMR